LGSIIPLQVFFLSNKLLTQFINLQQEHPNPGVALVTFSSDVNVHGDGLHEPIVIAGDHLQSPEYLKDISRWWSFIKSKNADYFRIWSID
jgi:hypothetical protein